MDDNEFGTFQPQQPTFGDTLGAEAKPAAPQKRRSRRAKEGTALAETAKPGKRKYTRKTKTAAIPAAPAVLPGGVQIALGASSELDFVMDIVGKLRGLDAKTRTRVMSAIGQLL